MKPLLWMGVQRSLEPGPEWRDNAPDTQPRRKRASAMSDAPSQARPDPNGDRTLALVNYVLLLFAVSNGVTALIALVIAFIRRETAPAWLRNHYDFQIRTVIYGIIIFVVGFATIWVLGLGLLIWLIGAVWLVVRTVVGLMRLVDGRTHPDPATYGI